MHTCGVGCRLVAGADGHMKARRCLCMNSKQRTVTTHPRLNISIVQPQCTASPAPGSRYCRKCKPDTDRDVGSGHDSDTEWWQRDDKQDEFETSQGGGVALDAEEEQSEMPTCNTVKDSGQVLNATSAGVLAVTWSCGVVIGLSELYGAESLTQVYAATIMLWDFMQYTPPFFFYDDGCHLAR